MSGKENGKSVSAHLNMQLFCNSYSESWSFMFDFQKRQKLRLIKMGKRERRYSLWDLIKMSHITDARCQ